MTDPMPKATTDLPRRLNLGCGHKRREGWLNVDKLNTVAPDLLWDLDEYPYPLPENHFTDIHAGDIVEHLADIPRFMRQTHALLAAGGELEITTPHFSCANSFTDPTHRHHLGYFSFDYFTESGQLNFYTDVRFQLVQRSLVFHPGRVSRLTARLANRWPALYERRFTWIAPAWFLTFRLRAIK